MAKSGHGVPSQKLPGFRSLGAQESQSHSNRRSLRVDCNGRAPRSGIVGSEFLPHLDEGAIWVRGNARAQHWPHGRHAHDESGASILSAFPEVKQVVSQVGRPDDGTDTAGFFNTEYFVDLKPKNQWRPVFREDKDDLIAAMDKQLSQIPGVLWNFRNPFPTTWKKR